MWEKIRARLCFKLFSFLKKNRLMDSIALLEHDSKSILDYLCVLSYFNILTLIAIKTALFHTVLMRLAIFHLANNCNVAEKG